MTAPWIILSVAIAISIVLVMVNHLGEAVREAFDPRQFAYYE